MKKLIVVDSVAKYNSIRGAQTTHPLINVLNYENLKKPDIGKYNFGIYAVLFKESVCGDIKYGKQTYDYQEESLIFIAPGQIFEIENHISDGESKGKALVFHPDFIRGTLLGSIMDNYTFFSYATNEALHLSENERAVIVDLFKKIEYELQPNNQDVFNKEFIIDYIKLFLNQTTRFYNRQFDTRKATNTGILGEFEKLVRDYLKSDKPQNIGLPMVSYFASELNLSANYFGDLIKNETGESPMEYIQNAIIEIAKEKLIAFDKTVSEVAFELGFAYLQHFTRMFKKKVGASPQSFRNSR